MFDGVGAGFYPAWSRLVPGVKGRACVLRGGLALLPTGEPVISSAAPKLILIAR
jgi:hypothetical protein